MFVRMDDLALMLLALVLLMVALAVLGWIIETFENPPQWIKKMASMLIGEESDNNIGR